MDDPRRSGPLVEIVDVLGAEEQVPSPLGKPLFKAGERPMRLVRLCREKVPATQVVEGMNQFGVPGEGFRCREFLRVEAGPEPLGPVPEGSKSAFCRYPRPRQNEYVHRLGLSSCISKRGAEPGFRVSDNSPPDNPRTQAQDIVRLSRAEALRSDVSD